MKIKTKKQLTLPQLIEYIFANNLKHKWKDSDNTGGYIHVYDDGKISVDKCTVDSIFTVEVEEEITEDTRLDELVIRYRNDDIYIFPQERINDFKNDSSIVAFYIPNDDLTLTLIWTQEKGLVE